MNKCVYCGSEGLEDVVIYVDYACKGGGGGWSTMVYGLCPF